MLGYLNFSEGKPDVRFQKQLDDAYRLLADQDVTEPWKGLYEILTAKLRALQASGASAFKQVEQAHAVLSLAAEFLPAYRKHHSDLLFHQSEHDLFQPFFLARVYEATLAQGPPWSERERILAGALRFLNDYVGHRPVAVLETRPKGEPYPHERVRPISLYIRGAGVSAGRYHDLLSKTLEILGATDPEILAEAEFDPEHLDELAVDPRAYDQGHPVNRRPNYIFGEWDPHHLDIQGRFRRYVVRQITLDGVLDRVQKPDGEDPGEILLESAAVLAGTILMASGISGSSPTSYDSSATLAVLMPRIARARDAFYANLMNAVPEAHGRRLREEATTTRQPFGKARQHLNEYLARHRAYQLQQRHLALLFAEMGYREASRREALRLPAASVRLLSEILSDLSSGRVLLGRGELAQAAGLLLRIEELLQRGIDCGALVDPWNILGFQGMFPLASAQEDSVRDTRIDDLIFMMEGLFNLYATLLGEAAASGQAAIVQRVLSAMRRLATWWDRFASVEVRDVRRLLGAQLVASTDHVATALGHWHERGEALADLAFWKKHLGGFQSAEAFARVIDPLLRKEDYSAAMGLLMAWLGQAEQIPLGEGDESFHALALRWMVSAIRSALPSAGGTPEPPHSTLVPVHSWSILVRKFFDHLEANAEEFWAVPEIESAEARMEDPQEQHEEDEDPYRAAYENVTYKDSADDEHEGAVFDAAMPRMDTNLAVEGERLAEHLHFLSTVARCWQIAAFGMRSNRQPSQEDQDALGRWAVTAEQDKERLLALLDAIHGLKIPAPLGSHESMVEFDRQNMLKQRLLVIAIGAALDMHMASGTLRGAWAELSKSEERGTREAAGRPMPLSGWEPAAMRLEQALRQGDRRSLQAALPAFTRDFHNEPLLVQALEEGGRPRDILRVRLAHGVLRSLVVSLPRLGLLRETYHLLKMARAMEQASPPEGRAVSDFIDLFEAGLQAIVENVIESSASWPRLGRPKLIVLLKQITAPFVNLWIEYSQTLQLSSLESTRTDDAWAAQQEFVRRYGGDLFLAKFMTLANLRGILNGGVGAYLNYLQENPDPLHPMRLADDIEHVIPRATAERHLTNVLQVVVENYEEYKDYNTTTAQSDYGENLYLLLDFLRLKAAYERRAWQCRPMRLVHNVLVRQGRRKAGLWWESTFAEFVGDAPDQYLQELSRLEAAHGIRLRTIRDRLEERFLKPLTVDRLCALLDPAMQQAQAGEGNEAFLQFDAELRKQASSPVGSGLDLPAWLRQLHQELERVRAAASSLRVLVDSTLQIPRKPITLEDLQQQLHDWERPPED
jgi:hypothetical protein